MTTRFSALTLGFFDVADIAKYARHYTTLFQCPNAGLLRCGSAVPGDVHGLSRGFSALTLGFFDVAWIRCRQRDRQTVSVP